MGRNVNWGEVPDSAIVPDGIYLVTIEEVTEGMSGDSEGRTPKLMYKAAHRIVEPVQFVNLPVYDNFVIGSDDDPNADDKATWAASIGARRMKRLAKTAQVGLFEDMELLCEQMKGQQVLAMIGQQTTKRGSVLNQVNSYHTIGECEVGVTEPHAGARPAAKPAARPATLTSEQQIGRTAAKPAAAAPAPAAAKPAPRPKVAGLRCSICPADAPLVARDQFAAHAEKHEAEMAEA